MDKKVIGKNISSLRKKQHMTQLELAEKLQVSDKTVSRWERGESAPSAFLLRKLAIIFSVDIEKIEGEFIQKEAVKYQKKINPLLKKIFLIVIVLIIFLIIFSWLIMIIYVKNNYNKFRSYRIVSEDFNNRVEGLILFTPQKNSLIIHSISVFDKNISKEKIYDFYYELLVDEEIIASFGNDINDYPSSNQTTLLVDKIKQISFNLDDYDSEFLNLLNEKKVKLVIKYLDEKLVKKEIIINLSFIEESANNKLVYNKLSEEEQIKYNILNEAFQMTANGNYTLGNLKTEDILNINDISLKIGDRVDVYVYSEEIDSELSKAPWLSNVYVFSLKDDSNNTYIEKNEKVTLIYLVEPTYELEKNINIKMVTELPGYTVEIKVNDSEVGNIIKINQELNTSIMENFEAIEINN